MKIELNTKFIFRTKFESLTSRELEVALYIMQGESTKSIGEILNVKHNTVSTYKKRVYSKLGICNDFELLILSCREGLIRI